MGWYGNRRFITVFTRAILQSPSWARSIQSMPPYPISLRSILILSSYLRLGLPSDLFPPCSPVEILHAFLFSSIRATCPAQVILLDLIILIILVEDKAPHYTVFSNLLSLHLSSIQIFSSALCSQTPSVHVPPLMSEKMFHTHTERQAKL
jgi:hypothetical protein